MFSWDKVPALRKARLEWFTKGVSEDFDTGGFDVFGYAGILNMYLAIIQHYHTNRTSTEPWPAVFAPYKDIEALPSNGSDVATIKPMSEFVEEAAMSAPDGRRNFFGTFTYRPTEELDIALFKIFEEGVEKVKQIPGIVALIPLQPLSKQAISKMSLRGGNSLGLKESDGPLVIYQLNWTWDRAEDDALILATVKDIMRKNEEKAKEMGLWHPYKYINYAEDWQTEDIYKGYGEDNLKTLKAVQRKFDPEGVFTKGGLSGGYFRLNEKTGKV